METITVQIFKDDVYEEVAKATDYTGAKLIDGDERETASSPRTATFQTSAGFGRSRCLLPMRG